MSIVIAVIIFGIIVIIHEFGHYIMAVRAGILVEEFALGMGPKLFGVTKGDTLYSIRLFPVGGFCKMLGDDADNDDERAFNNKSVGARISVISAGVVMNFLLALLIFIVLAGLNGFAIPVIKSVAPGLPAEAAQLRPGDRITSLNGQKVNIYEDLSYALSESRDTNITVGIRRDKEHFMINVVPVYDQSLDRYLIGFECQRKAPLFGDGQVDVSLQRANVLETFLNGYHRIFFFMKVNLKGIVNIFTFRADMAEVSGPIGIVNAIGETYEESIKDGLFYTIQTIMSFVAMLSASLALFNLLPLPALDGGRLIFLLIEAVRRKPVSPEKEGMVHFIGFVMLMILAVFVAYNDIIRIL